MKHLTEEQFVEWSSGERKDECAQHLRECPQCLDEVRELSMALEGFKAQIHDGAKERHVPFTGAQIRARATTQPRVSRTFWKLIPVPTLAAAAVLAIMLYKPAAPPPVTNVASSDEADNALLLAINSDVYRAAPSALRPASTLNQERNKILNDSQRKK
jgi:hypothetical protein